MLPSALRRMTRPTALSRTRLISQHMSMSSTAEEPTVLFESHGALRRYILNRPKKLNALDGTMIDALHPKIQEWGASELCKIIVGDGKGKAFCAGGDVRAVIMDAANEETRSKATGYFKKEFELDYQLATLSKPYVCILDGFTMGGGVGLSAHSPFRIATENTTFAMPETKIGYCPDVGASYFLPRLDGEIGTYLGLTGESVKGRAVFENGLATHFVPSRRIPQLLDILGSMEEPTLRGINAVIEEHYGEPSQEEEFGMIAGDLRVALDTAFGHNSVEEIFDSLREMEKSNSAIVGEWAKKTRSILDLRSPTSLKVALQAIRRGKTLSLASALRMEMGIATAFIIGASPDFTTGVTKVLVEGDRENRPAWSPASLSQVSKALVKQFFDDSEYLSVAPELSLEEDMAANNGHFNNFGLPSEIEIKQIVRGEHKQSGALALTLDELIQKFRSMRGDKNGLDLKVSEVVERKCDCDAEGYLRWK